MRNMSRAARREAGYPPLFIPLCLLGLVAMGGTLSHAADPGLTFEDRVRAQEAIDRVYYSHQLGATRPFDEVDPRAAIEAKVRLYLRQTHALEVFWATQVGHEALAAELERIATSTQQPERLSELSDALGDDP